MNIIFRILFSISVLSSLVFSNSLVSKNLYDKNITLNKGSFKILEFGKMIKSIKVSDSESIEIDFVDDETKPLQAIKISTKKIGKGNILISFYDSSSLLIDINITENIDDVISIAKQLSPNLDIQQINNKIVLKGSFENEKIKKSIINILRKTNIEIDDQLVDLTRIINPNKMIRIKLYVVEIDNNKELTIKNDWNLLGFDDGKTSGSLSFDSSTSISGGLSAIANRVGSKFNVGLALSYLESNNIAKILDETTLITLENNESKFHSGGTVHARTSTTDSVQFTKIEYGLKMKINVQQIIDDKFVKLLINTESSTIDDDLARIDDIPAIKNKTINTNVIVGNLSTIVLGGLINIGNTKDEEKIPLLGDIPLLGKLFTSSINSTDNKELAFFITPEIVDPRTNNQINTFNEKTSFKEDLLIKKEKKKNTLEDKEVEKKETKTSEHLSHEERVREILGN